MLNIEKHFTILNENGSLKIKQKLKPNNKKNIIIVIMLLIIIIIIVIMGC